MNNVISFKPRTTPRMSTAKTQSGSTVISLAEWKKAPRPHRTPTGVFYISAECGYSGDAA